MSTKRSLPISRLACASWSLAAMLAFGGCAAKSFAPVVDKQDRVVDPRLVGTWHSDDQQSVVIEERDSDYAIRYTENDGKAGSFDARLGRLGNRWILDLSPAGSSVATASDAYKALLLPLHTFVIIDAIGARMEASLVKSDSLEAYLAREPTAVGHTKVDDGLVLTAPTPELRAFLERYVNRPGVLDPAVWTRQ